MNRNGLDLIVAPDSEEKDMKVTLSPRKLTKINIFAYFIIKYDVKMLNSLSYKHKISILE